MALVGSLFLRWSEVLGPLAPVLALGCVSAAGWVDWRRRRQHVRAVRGVIGGRLQADAIGVVVLGGCVVALSLGGIVAVITGA